VDLQMFEYLKTNVFKGKDFINFSV
jgi:hypothetical protein